MTPGQQSQKNKIQEQAHLEVLRRDIAKRNFNLLSTLESIGLPSAVQHQRTQEAQNGRRENKVL